MPLSLVSAKASTVTEKSIRYSFPFAAPISENQPSGGIHLSIKSASFLALERVQSLFSLTSNIDAIIGQLINAANTEDIGQIIQF